MNLEKIAWVQEGPTTTLVIVNPKVNAISNRVIKELIWALGEIKNEEQIKNVVITGEGNSFFSAGADINEIAKFVLADKKSRKAREKMAFGFAREGQKLVLQIKNFSKPVMALINGACLGGGLELALACHKRIAMPSALLGFPEITLGIFPAWGGTYFLPRLVGISHATAMIKDGALFSSQKALDISLIDEVLAGLPRAREAKTPTTKISSRPPAPLISSTIPSFLEFQYEGYRDDIEGAEHALEEAAYYFSSVCVMAEAKEGIRAFLEKKTRKI